MSQPADPRQAFITGLRDLACYLAAHPAVPVPWHGTEVLLSARSTDDGGCAQVNQVARQLGVTPEDDLADTGHYAAVRCFGPVGYRMTAISDHAMARHRAADTYYGHASSPTPSPTPGPDALSATNERPDHAHHHPGLRQIRRRRQGLLHRRRLPDQRRGHHRRLPGLRRHDRHLQRLPLHLRVLALRRLHRRHRLRHRHRLHRPPLHGQLPCLRQRRHHQRNPHHHQRTHRGIRAGMR